MAEDYAPRNRQKRVPFDYADLIRLLQICDGSLGEDYELFEMNDKIFVAINDSDLFSWGYSGAIDITPADLDALEQTYKDVQALGETNYWAPHLYCCRKMKMRPQGAAYPGVEDEKLWELFDACGPKREVEFGNPKPHPRDA